MKALNSLLLVVTVFVITCNYVQAYSNTHMNSKAINIVVSPDSVEILTLIKNLLKWSETDRRGDFTPISDNDSVYTGIDWPAHKTRMEELSKTNFFTQEFIDNYNNIALHLDKELKQNQTKYHIGYYPPYGNDIKEWCSC